MESTRAWRALFQRKHHSFVEPKYGWISFSPIQYYEYASTTVLPISSEELEPVAVAVAAAAAAAAERSNSSISCGCCSSGCSSTTYRTTFQL